METPKRSLINIAPLAEVTISSEYKRSPVDNAEKEILTAEHDGGFSFHTELEDSPWILVDLKEIYCISHVRIINRLDTCKEKSSSLRIEYSNDAGNYNILLDINEVWGDVLDISVKDVDMRFLRLSLKEKQYFHLKKIEVFTDSEYIIRNCNNSTGKEIIQLCSLINQEFDEKFVMSFYDNTFNKVVLYEKDNIKSCFRYNITLNENRIFLYIELITKRYRDPDFYFFITMIARKLNYEVQNINSKEEDKLYLVKSIMRNKLIEEISTDVIINDTLICPFLKFVNRRKQIANEKSRYNRNKNNIVIINSDLVSRCGFADRLGGILSIIKICNEMNIDFFIKFDKPFELNKYYEFRDYNSIDSSRLRDTNSYSINLTSPAFVITDIALKEIILYSSRFFNIIELGTNLVLSPNEYKDTFSEYFQKTKFLEEKLSYYRKIINGEYVSISFRFLNCFGDFNETAISKIPILNEEEQIYLMNKCKQEIIKFKTTIDKKYKIVVLSDSSKFLNYISDIQNIYVFPENITHIGNISQNTSKNEDCFMKTLIDFNIIMEASHIYRFKTEYLYNTRFPWLASLCSGNPFSQHRF